MNAIIPKKRRDGKSSFEDLIAYTSVRDDVPEDELRPDTEMKAEIPHRNRFRRLVDYATRLRWICPYISRHLLSLNPLLACCRRYSRGER